VKISRMGRLAALGVTALCVAGSIHTANATPAAEPLQLTLPPPTGPHSVGTVSLHLVDPSRHDPTATRNAPRELMISLWYPTGHTHGYPVAPWLPAGAATRFLADNGLTPGRVRVPLTHGHEGAPLDRHEGRLSIVLYSPGHGSVRSASTVVVEELASRGYLVVTIDHTYDAEVVEFPDGHVVRGLPDGVGADPARTRVADTRFVLDQLRQLDNGSNPDAEGRRLPDGLRGSLDLCRIGMFGESAGGSATANTMFEDQRIRAGLSMDGPMFGPVVTGGLDRPFLLMDANRTSRKLLPDQQMFWSNLRGWRLNTGLPGAAHISYGDEELIVPQIAPLLDWSQEEINKEIGTLRPERVEAVQRAYPLAFFDLHLRHQGHLLDGPSRRYPEVTFIP
jgi:platelet-activating factor acetylhydrolase isoform II